MSLNFSSDLSGLLFKPIHIFARINFVSLKKISTRNKKQSCVVSFILKNGSEHTRVLCNMKKIACGCKKKPDMMKINSFEIYGSFLVSKYDNVCISRRSIVADMKRLKYSFLCAILWASRNIYGLCTQLYKYGSASSAHKEIKLIKEQKFFFAML